MKFDKPIQSDMLLPTIGPKSKPEVQFQHGGRLFSKPEIFLSRSAMDWVRKTANINAKNCSFSA